MPSLLPVSEAQSRLLALATPLETETVPLPVALGRFTAERVEARRSQPYADLSAMDGYAIRYADLPGPWRVVGESAAGRSWTGHVDAGQAVRIFTGAAVPEGADTILIQEEAIRTGDRLTLSGEGPPTSGSSIRQRGLDFTAGDTLLEAGERLTPARLALLAAGGHDRVSTRRKVRIAVAATGDELVSPGFGGDEATLPESNRLMLSAQLADLPVEMIDLGILPDDLSVQHAAFANVRADILVTSGGASVGDHDLVRPALEAAGASIDFWRVALRPGKPMMAGRLGETIVIGLPGNPVSAFVTALLFVRPLVAKLAGAADPMPRNRRAIVGTELPGNGVRADYLRGTHRDGRVYPAAVQDSSMLRTLAGADCLIVRPPHAPAAKACDSVDILDLA